MSPRIPPLTATLALALTGCASAAVSARPVQSPPAPELRAGARNPGAGPVPPSTPAALPRDAAVRAAIETARALVGRREIAVGGRRFGDDCAALVRAAYSGTGADLPPAATSPGALHAFARERNLLRRARPAPGDLVFLADRPGGPATHVGIVESVAPDGTALVLHRTGRGVSRLRVNATHPWKIKGDDGRLLNDPLVSGGGRIPAGRLFVAWASIA